MIHPVGNMNVCTKFQKSQKCPLACGDRREASGLTISQMYELETMTEENLDLLVVLD